jgi:anti-sigma B factor antagonist
MSLTITERLREGVTILDLSGRITAGDESTRLRSEIERVSGAEQPRLIINMRGVEYVDSTGLGALVMAATSMKKAGGAARLVHLNRRNMELLVMTKIDTIFEVFDDETDAVNSFFPGRSVKKFDVLAFIKGLEEE